MSAWLSTLKWFIYLYYSNTDPNKEKIKQVKQEILAPFLTGWRMHFPNRVFQVAEVFIININAYLFNREETWSAGESTKWAMIKEQN